MKRRTFLGHSAALTALGELGFLSRLPVVSAQEATVPAHMVRFDAEIEPLVRLLEETPRERVLEEFGSRIQRGLSYREVLAALMLAGVRSVQPRPVGFKFHAVLVVNSAHLASLASPDSDRWLPIFWALDQFKSSQAANVREGNWVMEPVEESKLPPAHAARQAFIDAMENWDESAADAAIVSLVRHSSAHDLFELFAKYGVRDFRDIGHKAIYVANSFRTLEVIGWQHAEPVLRSLAYALLDRSGANVNPAKADLPADRPFRENQERLGRVREGWTAGKMDDGATREVLQTLRAGSSSDASQLALGLLNRGVSPQSLFEGCFDGAGEYLMQAPGIVSLHAMTFTNAVHYAWQRVRSDETRRLLLLQNAAFLPLYRGGRADNGVHIDQLEPVASSAKGDEAVAEIFAEIGKDRLMAARKVLGYLKDRPDARAFSDAARRLVFMKGTNSHDYKFSSAVLEDYGQMRRPWRDQLLASSVFYFRGSGERDNELVERVRGVLGGS